MSYSATALYSLAKLARADARIIRKNNKAAIMRRLKAVKKATSGTYIYTTHTDDYGNKNVVVKSNKAVQRDAKKLAQYTAEYTFLSQAIPMVKDIYKWWKTIKNVGIRVYKDDEYYMRNPDAWDHTPKTMVAQGNIDLLRDSWKLTYDDYVDASKVIGEYNNKNTKK
jgi:hypothetical protein